MSSRRRRGDDLRSSPTFSLLPLPPQPSKFSPGKLLPPVPSRPVPSHVHSNSLTFFLHLDLETLLEPARLTLVPPRHVHDALAVLLADVVQVPAGGREAEMKIGRSTLPSFVRSFNHSDVTLDQITRRVITI